MATDLALLIDYYEAEKKSIEDMIKDNLICENYFDAYQNKTALNIVNQELEILYRLRDPNHLQKERLRSDIKYWQRFIVSFEEGDTHNNPYFLKIIESTRANRQKLMQLENSIPFLIDDQQLDDAVFDLIEGKILSFKLYLDVENNIYFEFSVREDHLIISLDLDKIADHAIYTDYQNKLLKFGFQVNSESATYIYAIATIKDAISIKELLSRAIYRLFNLDKARSYLVIKSH